MDDDIVSETDSSRSSRSRKFSFSTDSDSCVITLATYKRRWAILSLTTFYLITVGYNRACFGVVENVYTHYFQVSITKVDWLTLSMSAVSVFVCLYLLIILPIKDFGFRFYCLVTSIFIVVTYACHLASAFYWKLFSVSMVGQIVMGIVNTTSLVMIPLVAALWFPKEEIATAVGISLGGIAIGNILGFNIPAHFLDNKADLPEDIWLEEIRIRLIVIFATWLVMSTIVMLATFFIMRDRPVLPPSLSEAAKRRLNNDDIFSMQSVWSRMFYYFKITAYDRTFLALVLCFGIVETCYMLEVLMMADILRQTRSQVDLSTDSNVLAAYFLSSYAAGALCGGVASGIVLDKTKRFKEVAVISGLLMVLFAGGFLATVELKNVPGSLCTNFFYGFFNGACYTCLYEIIVQHMYPCSEMALGSWITFFVNLSALFVPLFGRFIYNTVSEIGVLVLQTVVLLIATIIIACLKPKYERYSINKDERDSPATPLVKSKK